MSHVFIWKYNVLEGFKRYTFRLLQFKKEHLEMFRTGKKKKHSTRESRQEETAQGKKIRSLSQSKCTFQAKWAPYSELKYYMDLCCLSSCPFSEMSQLSKIAAGVTENQRHRENNLQFNIFYIYSRASAYLFNLLATQICHRGHDRLSILQINSKMLKEGKEEMINDVS